VVSDGESHGALCQLHVFCAAANKLAALRVPSSGLQPREPLRSLAEQLPKDSLLDRRYDRAVPLDAQHRRIGRRVLPRVHLCKILVRVCLARSQRPTKAAAAAAHMSRRLGKQLRVGWERLPGGQASEVCAGRQRDAVEREVAVLHVAAQRGRRELGTARRGVVEVAHRAAGAQLLPHLGRRAVDDLHGGRRGAVL
jgi:hypothetical protein